MKACVISTGSTPAGLLAPVAFAAAAGELASSTPSGSGPVLAWLAGATAAPGPVPPPGPETEPPGAVPTGPFATVPATLPGAPGAPGIVGAPLAVAPAPETLSWSPEAAGLFNRTVLPHPAVKVPTIATPTSARDVSMAGAPAAR